MKITVVTSCFNAAACLRETAESVLGQRAVRAGLVELEYIVIDGASKDGTAGILQDLSARGAIVVSEPDKGLYDGLAKGLTRASGDVVGWLNAGDVLHPAAFDALVGAFSFSEVQWVTGCHVVALEKGPIVTVSAPWRYRRMALRSGWHDGRVLPFLQQEATYWRRSMMSDINWSTFAKYRLGGDGWLWARFAERAELISLHALIAEFRIHDGQLSGDMESYLSELRSACPERSTWRGILCRILAPLDRFMWAMGQGLKRTFNPGCIRFDAGRGAWVCGTRQAPTGQKS